MNRFVFAVLALALYIPPCSAQVAGFTDVPKNHWAAESVAKLVQAGIIVGDKPVLPKSTYEGNKPVTRYELAVVLYRFVTYIERVDRQKKSKFNVTMPPPKDGKTALARLVKEGYLKADSEFVKAPTKLVTANELATTLGDIITASRARTVPPSPDSLNAIPHGHDE